MATHAPTADDVVSTDTDDWDLDDVPDFEEMTAVGYIRLKIVKVSCGGEGAQLGGFMVWDEERNEGVIKGVANPEGRCEKGFQAVDGVSGNGKWWVDTASQPLIIELREQIVAKTYCLRTAGDAKMLHNDPVSWVLEGSVLPHGPWKELSTVTSATLPKERYTWSGQFNCHAPTTPHTPLPTHSRIRFTPVPQRSYSISTLSTVFQPSSVVFEGFLSTIDSGGLQWATLRGSSLTFNGKTFSLSSVSKATQMGCSFELTHYPPASNRVFMATSRQQAEAWTWCVSLMLPNIKATTTFRSVKNGVTSVLTDKITSTVRELPVLKRFVLKR